MTKETTRISSFMIIGLMVAWISGCAVFQSREKTDMRFSAEEVRCFAFSKAFDDVVEGAGTGDGQDAQIEEFPGIRVNRFLASFVEDLQKEAARKEWLKQTLRLERKARQIELANLPLSGYEELSAEFDGKGLLSEINICSEILMNAYLQDKRLPERLKTQVRVPDDYQTLARVFGLYPLSSWFVLRGLDDLQADARHAFQNPDAMKPGGIRTYRPKRLRPVLTRETRAGILERARSESALNIPEPDRNELLLLLDYFAPIYRIATVNDNDKIGRPFWQSDQEIDIDTDDPVVYCFHSFTRFGKEILLQLNYVIWYPQRQDQGLFDIYSGELDGLIWRVTLDRNGKVLLYDSVHPCGCYHKYFPVSPDLRPLNPFPTPEPALVFEENIPEPEKGRIIIHLNSREHYVVGLSSGTDPSKEDVAYRFEEYDALNGLPWQEGIRSMFSPTGIVEGTERFERWFVWPMGVPSAGAMRQRGRHAIALVGRQHFDDARLLESAFEVPE